MIGAPPRPDTAAAAGATRFPYHPALDGLRAIAVVAVVAYHLGWIRGGFLGVDLFFVLSGFLITSLLVGERERSGRVDLAAFWARRARRLLPALLLLLAVLLVVARASTPRADVFATLSYVANWQHIWADASYFDLYREPSPLRHAWSLGVEEQFYLVWPLLVAVAYRIGGRRALAIACVAGIATSVLLMARWFDPDDPSRVYYGTDTRAHLLLVGAVLALLPLRRWSQRLGLLALVSCVVAMFAVPDDLPALYRGGMVLNAVPIAVVLGAVVSRPDARLARALGVAPLRSLGRVSYGVYLWSWPVIVLVTAEHTGISGAPLDALRLAVIAGGTCASYWLVERPIRGVRTSGSLVLRISGLALAGLAVVAAVVVPVPRTEPVFVSDAPSLDELEARVPASVVAPPEPVATPAPPGARTPRRIAIVGDSIATSLGWGMDAVAPDYGADAVMRAIPGCGVAIGVPLDDRGDPYPWGEECARRVPLTLEDLVATSDPDVVVWLSSLDLVHREVDGRVLEWGTTEHRSALLDAMDEARLRLTGRGARVVFIAPSPPTVVDDYPPFPGYAQRRLVEYRELLVDYAADHPNDTALVDLQPIVCPGGHPCPVEVEGVRLRPDGAHFTEETSPVVARQLLPRILAAARGA